MNTLFFIFLVFSSQTIASELFDKVLLELRQNNLIPGTLISNIGCLKEKDQGGVYIINTDMT